MKKEKKIFWETNKTQNNRYLQSCFWVLFSSEMGNFLGCAAALQGTVLPPADDRDHGDQNVSVEPVDGDDGIGEHSAPDINAQGRAPAITTPPSSSSSASEVGTSSASVPSHQGVGGQNIAIELIDDDDDQTVQDHAEATVAPEIMIPSSSSSASSSESDFPIVW